MIPNRFAPALFGLILSGLMSWVVSGITAFRTVTGLSPDFIHVWLGAWVAAWLVAFPIVLIVAPLARRIVQRLVSER